MSKQLILLLISMCFIVSCSNNVIEEPDAVNFGYEFYPLSVGNEWIYQVDSSRIQGLNIIHSSSQIKEHIIDLISDDGDSRLYKVERSHRKTNQDNWKITDIWTVEINDGQVIRNEENQRFIKLVFPNVKNTSWNGNVFFNDRLPFYSGQDVIDNFYLNWKYKITETDINLNLHGNLIEGVKQVIHVNQQDEAGIDNRLSIEYFAPNIGLVKKDLSAFYSGTGIGLVADSIWLLEGDKGLTFSQELISYSIK
jgi:hypothetical protein